MLATRSIIALLLTMTTPEFQVPQQVRIPITAGRDIDLEVLVLRLAEATGQTIARRPGPVEIPINGPAGALNRRWIARDLGPETSVAVEGSDLVITLGPGLLGPGRGDDWLRRLDQIATRAGREAKRRQSYGMHALASYRPDDPSRPTVCLVHGLNSSSGGFVHMIRPLEEAGYGVVVFDYPFNRPLEESCGRFRRDWAEFRRLRGETRPWAIVAHSMGALVARSYVEDPANDAKDVSTLILIGPVSQGSSLAKAQTLQQWLNSVQAVGGKAAADPLLYLGDGLGEAAADLEPGSPFLTALNARPRRAGVPYHILAGDAGFLPLSTRRRIEAQLLAMKQQGGLFAGLSRLVSFDLPAQLDELCDGTGDGCVSVERSRLRGVTDHVTVHANHAELIRAPLLFPDPGPVVCMPYLLRWLEADSPRVPAGATSPARPVAP
jgi:pimeloyl-ACP methyl ester carboxylesterase